MKWSDTQCHERLSEYVLGTLEPHEVTEIEAYLSRSAEARAEIRALREGLVALTEALPQTTPSEQLWSKLEEAFEAEQQKPSDDIPVFYAPRITRYGWLVAACLALLVVSVTGWGLWEFQRQRQLSALLARFQESATVQRVALFDDNDQPLGEAFLADQQALFVMASPPGPGRVYQAWGHSSNDWEPGSSDRLTSLRLSHEPIFEVPTGQFAALYLSVEPRQGSDQPTVPIARLSLLDPLADAPVVLLSPEGPVPAPTAIISGLIDTSVRSVRYRLDDNEFVPVSLVGNRFTFTVTALQVGENRLEFELQLRNGETLYEQFMITRLDDN
jgi:hypothetical protein